MDRPFFRQGFPQKSWSPHTTGTWGRGLPMSIPRATGILGLRYLGSPCCECRLLRLPWPKRQHSSSKNTAPKAMLVSCDIFKAEYCLYVWLPGHISWTYPARKRKSLRLLSLTLTENRQCECFWYDCKCFSDPLIITVLWNHHLVSI